MSPNSALIPFLNSPISVATSSTASTSTVASPSPLPADDDLSDDEPNHVGTPAPASSPYSGLSAVRHSLDNLVKKKKENQTFFFKMLDG